MNTILELEPAEEGLRLDVFLAGALPGLSRSGVQRLLEAGLVTLEGKALKKNARTALGEVYRVEIAEPEEAGLTPQDIPLDVRYEDSDLLVINKPRGMVVHPAPGHPDGTLVNALLYHCGESLSGIGGVQRPGIVHRIDKDTSGLLIVAKNDFAHRGLSEQLKDHSLFREYEAVVIGNLKEDTGTVNAPIGRHPTDRQRMAVTEKGSRPAVTHWRVLERWGDYTHILCKLETGRTHQIRVHMAYLGHPLLGDLTYGRKKPELGLSGQFLHARRLRFFHPRSGEEIVVEAPLPEEFQAVLKKLGPGI